MTCPVFLAIMESRNRMGGQQRFPFFLFPLHFDHTHYPYFFSFVLGERRIVKMRRSSIFFFVRIFAKGKYRPKTRPISEKRCRLLFTYARAGGISALQNGKARRVSFRYIPFFAFTQRRGRRSFCRHAAQLRRLFSKPTERFKKTVRRLQTGRRRSTTYPQTARLTI